LLDFTGLRSLPWFGLDRAKSGRFGAGVTTKSTSKFFPFNSTFPRIWLGTRALSGPRGQEPNLTKLPLQLSPFSWCGLCPRHLSRFVAEHRALRVFGRLAPQLGNRYQESSGPINYPNILFPSPVVFSLPIPISRVEPGNSGL
jgi:hypothetical protein